MRPYLIFPKVLPRLIQIHMTNLMLPLTVLHVAIAAYHARLKEVMQ